ncbi:MAG: protein TolQ [Rhodobacteraceae bacterium]|nr:protein TolQ [Paracoccaceae bacterium]
MDPTDFTLWALFARATFTVKLVMLLLFVASIWGWAIIVQKHIVFRAAKRAASRFDRMFWSGEPLDGLYADLADKPRTAPERIFVSGMTEWHRSHRDDGAMIPGATARIDRSMDVAIAREADRLNTGLPFLATVGSTAPFIGLFGTVWGIMNAFAHIDPSRPILETVTPHIAEALVATAIGLLAAIPAVMAYNGLIGRLRGLQIQLDEFGTDYLNILRRHFFS